MTLAEINDELGAARTNKKECLEKLKRFIPWATFMKLIEPCYYKGERGNKPYPLELMLRIFLFQNVYNLADMKVMNEVIDSRAFSMFCGINSPDEVPDGDTIGHYHGIFLRHCSCSGLLIFPLISLICSIYFASYRKPFVFSLARTCICSLRGVKKHPFKRKNAFYYILVMI